MIPAPGLESDHRAAPMTEEERARRWWASRDIPVDDRALSSASGKAAGRSETGRDALTGIGEESR